MVTKYRSLSMPEFAMIARAITPTIERLAAKFPVVSLTGPRQSGKSTLLRHDFSSYDYLSLEDEDIRSAALEDPRGLLARYDHPTIFDEAQYVPALFSYLQGVVDEPGFDGSYILSGSQNFLLLAQITQSLAGRVAVLTLPTLSLSELKGADMAPKRQDAWIVKGGYPRLWADGIEPADYFPHYITTYLERDARQGAGVQRLADYHRLMALCAHRTSQILNVASLANDCGVTQKTANGWLSALAASFVVFTLPPYFSNAGKRLVKRPKLYFWDTGLAANLIGLEDADELVLSELRGPLFENAVVGELMRLVYAKGRTPRLSFWRERGGSEVDIVVERGGKVSHLIECKASATYRPAFFDALTSVGEELGVAVEDRIVVYGGEETFETKHGTLLSYRDLDTLDQAM